MATIPVFLGLLQKILNSWEDDTQDFIVRPSLHQEKSTLKSWEYFTNCNHGLCFKDCRRSGHIS